MDDNWNILIRTNGGVVSLLKNLTEEQARGAMQRLSGRDPWGRDAAYESAVRAVLRHMPPGTYEAPYVGRCTTNEKGAFFSSSWSYVSSGDFKQIDCWGTSDTKFEVWPKPDDYDERYAKAYTEMLEQSDKWRVV